MARTVSRSMNSGRLINQDTHSACNPPPSPTSAKRADAGAGYPHCVGAEAYQFADVASTNHRVELMITQQTVRHPCSQRARTSLSVANWQTPGWAELSIRSPIKTSWPHEAADSRSGYKIQILQEFSQLVELPVEVANKIVIRFSHADSFLSQRGTWLINRPPNQPLAF